MDRRQFITNAAAVAAAAPVASVGVAQAQTSWPDKPVRVVLPYAPGGATDAIGRPWADELSKALGQQFVIENRGGAAGQIGVEAVVKANPDGYTFLMSPNAPMSVLPVLKKVPYDPVKNLVAGARTGDVLCGFVIHPSLGIKTLKELVDYAKKNPGKVIYGSSGNGAANHLRLEALKLKAGIDILHVPYRGGGESLADFLAGVHQIHADPNTMPHIAAGKANLLAVLDRKRHPDYPSTPLLKEILPDIDFVLWFGVVAPPGTPPEIVKKFSEAIAKISKDADLEPILRKAALAPHGSTPEAMLELTKKDHARFGDLIRRLNIKAE